MVCHSGFVSILRNLSILVSAFVSESSCELFSDMVCSALHQLLFSVSSHCMCRYIGGGNHVLPRHQLLVRQWLLDRPPQQQCGQQALVNPAQNRLLANTVAADMLSSLLADLHQVVLQLFWLAQSIAYQVVLDMLDGSSMLILHPHCLLVLRQVLPCFES